jgi:hypothetical protein
MGVHGYCLPQKTLIEDNFVETSSFVTPSDSSKLVEHYFPENLMRCVVTSSYELGEAVRRDVGRDGSAAKSKEKDRQDAREKLALLPGSDLPGFIPLREDFDVEYENDAELMLADMEFLPHEDHPSERELKLQVVHIYNSKLRERNMRKRFVIDRGLVDFKQQQMVSSVVVFWFVISNCITL